MNAPRSLEFYIFRLCERFGWEESTFRTRCYADQIRYLAYELLRQNDERCGDGN